MENWKIGNLENRKIGNSENRKFGKVEYMRIHKSKKASLVRAVASLESTGNIFQTLIFKFNENTLRFFLLASKSYNWLFGSSEISKFGKSENRKVGKPKIPIIGN